MNVLPTLVALFLLATPIAVQADDDHEQARRLKQAGQIVPLEQIVQKAQQQQPGRVIEVELEMENGRHVYEVELLDEQGKVWEFYFDAATAELLKREQE